MPDVFSICCEVTNDEKAIHIKHKGNVTQDEKKNEVELEDAIECALVQI